MQVTVHGLRRETDARRRDGQRTGRPMFGRWERIWGRVVTPVLDDQGKFPREVALTCALGDE